MKSKKESMCVCVCVRARARAYTLHVYASLCWYYSLTPCWEDWFTVNSLDFLTIFRRCLLRVFPLTITILIADFRDFPRLSMQSLGYTSIRSRPLASTSYQIINHHSPTIPLYKASHTSWVAKWATNKAKYIKTTRFYCKGTWNSCIKVYVFWFLLSSHFLSRW
jgi:hypothetical protein